MAGQTGKKIRIGILHRFDAQDVRSCSGLLFFMAKALEEDACEVVYLGPDRTRGTQFLFGTIWRINSAARLILGKDLIGEANRVTSRRLARIFKKRLAHQNVDVIVAPFASAEIAYLKTKAPIVYLSDITWKNIVDYYAEFSSLSSLAKREGEHIEMRAIQKASAVVYPSEWPAQTALEHYHAHAWRIFEIPFGANLRQIPSRQAALDRRPGSPLQLLWVGVDWERKGGAVAVECLEELLKSGMDARLTVCGCTPPAEVDRPEIRIFSFLNKHDPEQSKILSDLFLRAHFFIFPTRAEAFGIVVAEASAHGLPSLANATGGVSGALHNGQNGFLMPANATGKTYAEKIRAILDTPNEYERLVRASRDLFEQQLNWDAWGNAMRHVISQVTEDRSKEQGATIKPQQEPIPEH